MIILLASFMFPLCVLVYCMFRDVWVINQRLESIYGRNGVNYETLPSYEGMLYWYFWIWNIKKFPKKGSK